VIETRHSLKVADENRRLVRQQNPTLHQVRQGRPRQLNFIRMGQEHAEKSIKCVPVISDYRSIVVGVPSQVLAQCSSSERPTELLQ